MKQTRKYLLFLLGLMVVLINIATFLTIRAKNPEVLRANIYQTWKKDYLVNKSKNQTFVNSASKKSPQTLSEAQGYGMIITAKAGKRNWASQEEFDKLLNYYLAHLDHAGDKSQIPTSLMQWHQYYNKKHYFVSLKNSATDGDLYIAYSLHIAAKAWPKSASYYHQLESRIASDILKYEYNPKTGILTTGDWVKLDSSYAKIWRTSDTMPHIFEILAKDTHNSEWLKVEDKMLKRLWQLSRQHQSGLVPDFAWVSHEKVTPVKAKTVWSKDDGHYAYNACRIPIFLVQSDHPLAEKINKRILTFFSHQGYISGGYNLAGKRLVKYQSPSFSAPVFYAVNCNRGKGYDNLFESQKFIFCKKLDANNYYGSTLVTLAAISS